MKKILLSISMIAVVGVLVAGATGAFFSDTETSTGNTFTAGAIDLTVDNTSYFLNPETGTVTWSPGTSWLQPANLGEGHLFFNFDDIKPGDWFEDTISLHVADNDSWLCADVTLTSDNNNSMTEPESDDGDVTPGDVNGIGEGELADAVYFAWWNDDGDNVLETCENTEIQNCVEEELLPAGPLGVLNVDQTATVDLADVNDNIWGDVGPLPGGSTRYIGKAACFGSFSVNAVEQDGNGLMLNGNNPSLPIGTNGPDVRNSGISCNGAGVNNVTQTDSMTADISFRAVQSRNNASFECAPISG